MARYTTFNPKENGGGGITNRWQVTRYKSSLGAGACLTADVGTAGDHGVDPTAATILAAGVTSDTSIASWPTHREWSAGVEAILFWVEIEGNTADDLKLDLEFYEGVYGSTGVIESYRKIGSTFPNITDGEVVGVESDGAQVFARIAGITNPDGSASLYLQCKRSSHSVASLYEGGGDGLDLDLTGIGRAVAAVVDDHDAAHTHELGLKILAEALTDPTSDQVDDGDMTRPRATIDGALYVAGYDRAASQGAMLPVEISNAVASGYGVPALGRASITVPTAVADGDVIAPWLNRSGATAVCGFDVANNVTRELPVASNSSNHPDVGVTVSWRADAGIPTAVADGEAVAPRADLTGSAGTHLTNGLNYTNDSVTNRKQPPTGGAPGSTNISNAASTALNGGTSIPCVEVTVMNNGTGWMRVGVGTQTATTGIVLQPGDARDIEIDDVAKVEGWTQNNNDPCGWDYRSM